MEELHLCGCGWEPHDTQPSHLGSGGNKLLTLQRLSPRPAPRQTHTLPLVLRPSFLPPQRPGGAGGAAGEVQRAACAPGARPAAPPLLVGPGWPPARGVCGGPGGGSLELFRQRFWYRTVPLRVTAAPLVPPLPPGCGACRVALPRWQDATCRPVAQLCLSSLPYLAAPEDSPAPLLQPADFVVARPAHRCRAAGVPLPLWLTWTPTWPPWTDGACVSWHWPRCDAAPAGLPQAFAGLSNCGGSQFGRAQALAASTCDSALPSATSCNLQVLLFVLQP